MSQANQPTGLNRRRTAVHSSFKRRRLSIAALAAVAMIGSVAVFMIFPCSDILADSREDVSYPVAESENMTSMSAEHVFDETTVNDIRADDLEIVCWGDSLTEGVGAGPALIEKDDMVFDASYLSYPEILEELTGIRTYNFGVAGASSEEIAFMQGALTIEDLMYDLDIVDDDVMQQGDQHTGSVLVLEIGSNGGWNEDYETLIKQYQDMIDHSGCDDYIIIGDTDDPGTSVADMSQEPFVAGQDTSETSWEAALSEAFGEHFINMRVYLVEQGLEVAGLEATEEDEEAASQGCVSEQLRADWTHLNSYGYYAQATAIYQKGKDLGYW